jgi:hypothetical protein
MREFRKWVHPYTYCHLFSSEYSRYMLQFKKKIKNIDLDIYVIREEACMQMCVDHVLDPE